MNSFVLQFLSFIFLNAVTLFSAILIYNRLHHFQTTPKSKEIIGSGIIFFSLICCTQIVLGIFGTLTFFSLLSAQIILCALLIKLYGRHYLASHHYHERSSLPWLPGLFILGPIIVLGVLRFFNASFQVPLEYDNLAYHLPFAVEWMKTGDLLQIYYSAFASPLGYYPSNFELIDLWTMLPFQSDNFVNLINFPVAALLIVALYSLCQKLSFSKLLSVVIIGLFMYMPQTLRQLGVPLVDLFFSFTFIASLYFLVEYSKTSARSDSILFGLSLGLFIGTKYLGIVYATLPLGVIFIVLIMKRNFRTFLKDGAAVALTLILTGGFWYIRNWMDAGNPLFPVNVQLGTWTLFEGYRGISERLFGYSLIDNVTNLKTFTEFTRALYAMVGVQIFLIPVVFAGLLIDFLYLCIRTTFSRYRELFIRPLITSSLLLFSGIFYAYLYWKAPYTYINLIPNVRYAFMFLIIFVIAFGYLVQRLRLWKEIVLGLTGFIFLYNLALPILSPSHDLIMNDKFVIDFEMISQYTKELAVLICSMVFFMLLLFVRKYGSESKVAPSILAIISIIFGTFFFQMTLPIREELRPSYYRNWNTSNKRHQNILDASQWFTSYAPRAAIAYTGFNYHYALFGPTLDREVDYININECSSCRYKDYKNSPQSIRRDPSYENWVTNLKLKSKEYVVIVLNEIPGVVMHEYQWVNDHPELFEKVFEKKDVYVYKIKS